VSCWEKTIYSKQTEKSREQIKLKEVVYDSINISSLLHQMPQITVWLRHKVNSSWCIGILIVASYFAGSPLQEREQKAHMSSLFPSLAADNQWRDRAASYWLNRDEWHHSQRVHLNFDRRIQKSYPSFDGARKKAFHWHTEGNTKCWYRTMWGLKYIKLQISCAGSLNHCILHSLKTYFGSLL